MAPAVSLVFVDVDGTLICGPPSERLFLLRLVARGLVGPPQLLSALVFLFRWGGTYGRRTWRKDKAYLDGLAVGEVAALARAFVDDVLLERLRPAVLRRLEAHRRAGETVVVLSGTPDFIAAPLAERLGIGLTRATHCAERDGSFASDPPAFHPFAEEKLRCAAELAQTYGAELSECAAYGDSIFDAPLLGAVGRPVAVFPDRGLRRAALRAGWEVLEEPPRDLPVPTRPSES